MARPPRFTISALADLLHELRYAPPETLSRQMQAAEKLLNEIEPQRNYPEDYVRFRITGFRGERSEGALFVGSALVGDLAKFIERLSAALSWSASDYAPRTPLPPDEVARRLSVSAVTLHRYRKEGLVAHQVRLGNGRPRLVYFADAVERFVSARPGRVEHAARFSRIDAATRQRIICRARRYAQTLDLSLNESALRLARRFGRSHEGIRRVLQQHDRQHPAESIFADHGPMTDRQRRLVLRAHDRAVPASEVAHRVGRSVNTIYRTALEQRAQRLRSWPIRAVELPTFTLKGADEVILTSPVATRGLPVDLDTGGDFTAWIDEAPNLQLEAEVDETQGVAALHYLLWSARRIIERLDRHQSRAADIDLAETRLRWATRLKLKLLAGLRSSLISHVEIHLGRKLRQSTTTEIEAAYRLIVAAGLRGIDTFDSSRQGRLGQVAVHALRSDLARRWAPPPSSVARARHEHGGIRLPDLGATIYPWRGVLELNARALPGAARLSADSREILAARFGWTGQAPLTHAAIAAAWDRPVHRIVAAEQRARRQLAQILREYPS
ncbi:MAG: hypothetical protein IT430_05300 [Phycisphaerales bacterium]|nr:hypothetical protein [Phycisphaerales bacterium]